ncbi:acetate kinase [Pseudonocardia sediminis]|uniref:Acetate kinase n=1 Tax=Pseudonocardia sediminis TaxID=1397368 RepID=A0A4Q7V2C3_PSEST|nr:acetate/propionate family kinase [Pseudonocardia sediminis]RZT86773.1 acetate kinase [Pseudonocardia sediminis]
MSRILVVNAGSSSVKLSLLDGTGTERTDSVDPDDAAGGIARFLTGTADPDGVGHRVVHGGTEFTGPVRVDDDVLDRIERLRTLAPLHQGPAVAALRHTREALPGVGQVACFDTAFHATMPAAASTYAVPARWRDEFGVRRYGFHGLAHEWAARRTAQILGRPVGDLRIVNAHLGSGASLCAIHGGVSVDTTMGFTPTAGLVMGTRSGDLDPAVPLWLVERGLDRAEVAEDLDRHSGLLGLTGRSDTRVVEEAAGRGDPEAVLALQVWAHRARAQVAAMVAAMGGIDALTFSGGVGEHRPGMRARITDGLGFLRIALDHGRNERADGGGDAVISPDGSAVTSLVVGAREDLVVAEQVRSVLDRP